MGKKKEKIYLSSAIWLVREKDGALWSFTNQKPARDEKDGCFYFYWACGCDDWERELDNKLFSEITWNHDPVKLLLFEDKNGDSYIAHDRSGRFWLFIGFKPIVNEKDKCYDYPEEILKKYGWPYNKRVIEIPTTMKSSYFDDLTDKRWRKITRVRLELDTTDC